MTAVGFEPTQLALVELESTPLDHSGKLSLLVVMTIAGIGSNWGVEISFWIRPGRGSLLLHVPPRRNRARRINSIKTLLIIVAIWAQCTLGCCSRAGRSLLAINCCDLLEDDPLRSRLPARQTKRTLACWGGLHPESQSLWFSWSCKFLQPSWLIENQNKHSFLPPGWTMRCSGSFLMASCLVWLLQTDKKIFDNEGGGS